MGAHAAADARSEHRILTDDAPARLEAAINRLEQSQRRQNRVLLAIAAALAILVAGYFLR